MRALAPPRRSSAPAEPDTLRFNAAPNSQKVARSGLLTLRCEEQGQALSRAAQSQESNVPPGYGVGWRPPPGLVESVGIHNG